jgi:hypothetical protein
VAHIGTGRPFYHVNLRPDRDGIFTSARSEGLTPFVRSPCCESEVLAPVVCMTHFEDDRLVLVLQASTIPND